MRGCDVHVDFEADVKSNSIEWHGDCAYSSVSRTSRPASLVDLYEAWFTAHIALARSVFGSFVAYDCITNEIIDIAKELLLVAVLPERMYRRLLI